MITIILISINLIYIMYLSTSYIYKHMPQYQYIQDNISPSELKRYLQVDESSRVKDVFYMVILAIITSKIIDATFHFPDSITFFYKLGMLISSSGIFMSCVKTHRIRIKLIKLDKNPEKQQKFMNKLGFKNQTNT